MPVPSSSHSERGPFGTIRRTVPMRIEARTTQSVHEENAGPDFSPQNPIAAPIESQRKLFPRPTHIPRLFKGMRQRLQQVFRRDATRRAAGPAFFHRSNSSGQIGSFRFWKNSQETGHKIWSNDDAARLQNGQTRPVAYRRPLPLSELNGKTIQPEPGRALSGPLVELGIPEMPRPRADRWDDTLTTLGSNTPLTPPRQAGPSTNRAPLMAVPLENEPLEMWPHSPSAAIH